MRSFTGAADDLLERRRPDEGRRLGRRELRVDVVAAAAFALVASVLALVLPGAGPLDPRAAVLLVAAYALTSRVKFQLGPGFLRPTQLVFVPMLLLLPAPAVPLLVAGGAALAQLPELVRRRTHPERLLVAVADSWYAIGASVVVGLAAPVELGWSAWPVYLLALLAQFAGDLAVSTLREWTGCGTPPLPQAKVIGLVYLADLLLAPIGLLAAFAARSHPYAYLLAVPAAALLALVARERGERIERALALGRAYRANALLLESQADDLRRQAARLERSHRRVGEAVASTFDRAGLERVLVTTVDDALGADEVRIVRGADLQGAPGHRLQALGSAVAAARVDGGAAYAVVDEVAAMAVPLGDGPDVLAVVRRGRAFAGAERDLLADLAAQATVSLEQVATHEALRAQASLDALTGLLNRRRFDELLHQEVAAAEGAEHPIALVMLDVDDFKRINDTHGHPVGDQVLAEIGRVTRSVSRHGDHAGRYGGEELAVVLPGAGLQEATRFAERLRRAVGELSVALPLGGSLAVTASLGVAALPETAGDGPSLLEAADAALYAAKRGGKNRVAQAAFAPVALRAAAQPPARHADAPSRRFRGADG